jgi:hypothetical protein
VAVGDGVFASPTLDVVVFVVAAFEEDGGIGVGSVAGRLASSARLRSCRMYARKRKSSAHACTIVFQKCGSADGFILSYSKGATRKAGRWLFHIPKRGRGIEDIAIEARAPPTSSSVIIGSGVVDVVVVAVGDSRGRV